MSKTINKQIISGLGILGIVAVFALASLPSMAFAKDGEFKSYNKPRRITYTDTTERLPVVPSNAIGGFNPYTPPVPIVDTYRNTSYGYGTSVAYNGSSSASNTVVANPTPVIYSVTPNTSITGEKTATIAVTGANFDQRSVVLWNSSGRKTTFIDSTHLAATLTEEDLNTSGEYLVSVLNRGGGGYSNAVIFSVVPSMPATAGTTDDKNTDLSASAGSSGKGFLSFSLLSWILFAILILLGMILWRKVYLQHTKHKGPMKHA